MIIIQKVGRTFHILRFDEDGREIWEDHADQKRGRVLYLRGTEAEELGPYQRVVVSAEIDYPEPRGWGTRRQHQQQTQQEEDAALETAAFYSGETY